MSSAIVSTVETRTDKWNNRLKTICAVLLVFAGSHVLLQIASMPRYYQLIAERAVPEVYIGTDLVMSNALVAEFAAVRDMTVEGYALYSIGYNLTVALGFISVALLILWKARQEWFHWFTALVLIFYPTGGLWQFTQVTQIGYRYIALGGILWPSFFLFLYLFPNGRAVPRWTRWIIGPMAALHFIIQFIGVTAEWGLFQDAQVLETMQGLFVFVLAVVPVIVLCQIYRYWRGSTLVERAQIRWFVAGFAFWAVASGVLQPDSSVASLTYGGLAGDLGEFLAVLVPLSIGVGILRYRLWDIDLIIRRTLIYGVLTGALALTYWGLVLVLQQVFGLRAGEMTQFAIVASTLAIAALFQPLHRRVQQLIDRRFYRRRYNAQATLAAFGDRLRTPDNAALDKLTGELVGVIQETMQPVHLSVWVRPTLDRSGRKLGEPTPPLIG